MTDLDLYFLDRLASSVSFLPDKPEESAETTLRALYFAAVGTPMSVELAGVSTIPDLDEASRARLAELVESRVGGTPLAHLTQRQSFMGLEMLAGPEALVPRRETELLGAAAIACAKSLAANMKRVLVVDACTGSGNVALAVAKYVPNVRVVGADLSEDAIMLARMNADHLGLSERVQFVAGDLLTPINDMGIVGEVDVLTCNPPYINSGKVDDMAEEISQHEPRLAFDGGPFGVAILMRLIQEAPLFLRSGGSLIFEVGLGQGPAMVKRLQRIEAFDGVTPILDEHEAVRAIAARRR